MTEALATQQQELVGKYRPYPEYKDFGIEWFDKIPTDWKVVKLGFVAQKIGSGKTPSGGATTYVDEGVTFLRSQNVYDDGLRLDDVVYITPEVDSDMHYSRVKPMDVLINITGASIGRTTIVPLEMTPANVNQHVCIVRLRNKNLAKFSAWAIKAQQTKSQIDNAQTGAAREGLNFEQVANLLIATPPENQYEVISSFLDYETARIDRLITQQQRLIELLKEKRQAVISHAVTKGINPDASMKDSGVEWLGQVPEHWGISQPRYLCRFVGGGTPSKDNPEFWDGDLPWVSPKDMKQEFISNSIDRITERAVSASSVNIIPSSAVLMVVRGMILAHSVPVALTTKPVTINQDMKAMIVDNRRLNSVFWLRCLQGLKNRLLDLTESSAHGTKCLRSEDFETLSVPIPPLEEQLRILDYLDSTLGHIDLLLVKATKLICLAEERRTALISAAVTGKIDLRGWTPPVEEVAA